MCGISGIVVSAVVYLRRMDFITRPRHDARLYEPPLIEKHRCGGRLRKWGRRVAAPKDHDRWQAPWKSGRAYIYGRMRRYRSKRILVPWAVGGPKHLVHAYVFEVGRCRSARHSLFRL